MSDITIDGYLEEAQTDDGVAKFRLVTSPSDDAIDESVIACVASDPLHTTALTQQLQPGDHLRVTGALTPHSGLSLHVHTIDLLGTAPLLAAELPDGATVHRLGSHLYVQASPQRGHIWASDGAWVGTAPDAETARHMVNR